MKKTTGYWTFFCNPKRWNIDDFLNSGQVYDTFTISDYHKNEFKKGQLGVVRVGHDRRTIPQLDGKERLERGIYAVVEVLGEAELMEEKVSDYIIDEDLTDERYRVHIKYIRNLINNPISLDSEIFDGPSYDKYLVEGQQGSTMPLKPSTFDSIINKIGEVNFIEFDFLNQSIDTMDKYEELVTENINAVPEVKEVLSKRIERGAISKKVKELTGFKCQICDELDKSPYVFKKSNGEYYIETHHIFPVSQLVEGSLALNNLITVCPNHHRQLHYGDVIMQENDSEKVVFKLDGEMVRINKITLQ